jgi:hypothetical protein
VEEGSLYPALYRIERQGWITAEWGVSENNLRAKFYKLTRAGLMIRSFYRLTSVDPGFQPDKALTMRMQLSGEKYGDPVKRRMFYYEILQQLQAMPGVLAAGVIT